MTDALPPPDLALSLPLACPVCHTEREPVTADGWLYDRCAACRRDDLVPRRWALAETATLVVDGRALVAAAA